MGEHDVTAVEEFSPNNGIKATALTDEEKATCQNVITFGLEYLRTVQGWTMVATRSFLARVEVTHYLIYLRDQYLDRTAIQERTQFFAQLRVNAMVPLALQILMRSVVGVKVSADGKTIERRAPDRAQFDAAIEILNRANIQGGKFAGNNQLPNIDARTVNVNINEAAAGQLDSKGRKKVSNILKGVLAAIKSGDAADAIVEARKLRPAARDDEEDELLVPELPRAEDVGRPRRTRAPDDDDPRDRG